MWSNVVEHCCGALWYVPCTLLCCVPNVEHCCISLVHCSVVSLSCSVMYSPGPSDLITDASFAHWFILECVLASYPTECGGIHTLDTCVCISTLRVEEFTHTHLFHLSLCLSITIFFPSILCSPLICPPVLLFGVPYPSIITVTNQFSGATRKKLMYFV